MVIMTIYRSELPKNTDVTPEILAEVASTMEEFKRPGFIGIRRVAVRHYMSRTMVEFTVDVEAEQYPA